MDTPDGSGWILISGRRELSGGSNYHPMLRPLWVVFLAFSLLEVLLLLFSAPGSIKGLSFGSVIFFFAFGLVIFAVEVVLGRRKVYFHPATRSIETVNGLGRRAIHPMDLFRWVVLEFHLIRGESVYSAHLAGETQQPRVWVLMSFTDRGTAVAAAARVASRVGLPLRLGDESPVRQVEGAELAALIPPGTGDSP